MYKYALPKFGAKFSGFFGYPDPRQKKSPSTAVNSSAGINGVPRFVQAFVGMWVYEASESLTLRGECSKGTKASSVGGKKTVVIERPQYIYLTVHRKVLAILYIVHGSSFTFRIGAKEVHLQIWPGTNETFPASQYEMLPCCHLGR